MPRALRQLDAIASWWRTNRVDAPELARDELSALLVSLEQHPERGMRAARGRGNTRALVAPRTKLLVIYRVRRRVRRVEVVELRRP